VEADWEVEIGPGAPVIDALWDGFIDLRMAPGRISEIEEAQGFLPLQRALLALNVASSTIWTAKCDLWTLQDFDPSEMEAPEAEAGSGLGCYIDLFPRSGVFLSIAQAEEWVRKIVASLKQVHAPCCRVDLVIREAVSAQVEGFGVTAYITACGSHSERARIFLDDALERFVRACEAAFEPTNEAIQ
jgi:hypothetical protein